MVEWTDEAIEEALNAYSDSWRCYYEEDNELCRNRMRAALDAAVKVQGLSAVSAYMRGRADAFMQAAQSLKTQADVFERTAKSDGVAEDRLSEEGK